MKEQPLYIQVWNRVAEDVKSLPKESVRHITDMVKLMMEREDQIQAANQPLIQISSPNGNQPYKLKEEDVWGKWSEDRTKKLTQGMIVAKTGDECPHFGDIVPHKAVTVVCNKEQVDDVTYWLEYVHGGDCVSEIKDILGDKKVAIRSEYQLDSFSL